MRKVLMMTLVVCMLMAGTALAADSNAVPAAKIGVVDMQTVATQSEPAEAAKKQMEDKFGKERTALEKQGEALKNKAEALKNPKVSEEKKLEFIRAKQDLDQKTRNFLRKVEQEEVKLRQDMVTLVFSATYEVARAKGFNFVVDEMCIRDSYYSDYGYAFAEVDTKLIKADDGSDQVDVGYLVNKKQKVFIRRLVVEGNTKTRDNVILREMRLGDGDMYEGAKLRRSNERLNRLRYFGAVDMELIPTGQEDEVDLKVKVKESNTGAIMGGIGYSSYYDVGVSASIMERNLFGRGYWLQLQGFFSWRRTSGTLSFTNPRVYDTDLSFGNDIYYTHDYWDNFTKDTIGDTVRFGYPIGEYTTVGVGYRLERYYLYDVSENSSPYIRDYKGINWTSAVSGRILRDTTDSKERPTKGTISRLWAEYGGGGIGGTDNFIKSVADWQGFWSFNPQNTVHLRGRVGGVFQNTDDKVPVFERFWVGGMDTIRGYSYSDLSPRDYKHGGEQIGGDRMGVANLEYIWTFQKELGLALVPFVDSGFNIDAKTDRKSTRLNSSHRL